MEWIWWFMQTPQGIILLLPVWLWVGYALSAMGGAIIVILLSLPLVPIHLFYDWVRNRK